VANSPAGCHAGRLAHANARRRRCYHRIRRTDPTALVTVATALVAVHDWIFLVGPNFVLGTNTVLLALLLYRSRLVPRFIRSSV
jgi:Domain of unknown function (DUF4386)